MILQRYKTEISLFKMNQEYIETFRREKSARNTIVSSTRNYWDLRLNN